MSHDDLIKLIEWNTKVESYEKVILMINEKLLDLLKMQQKEKDDAGFILRQGQIHVLDEIKTRIRTAELGAEMMIHDLQKEGDEDDE